MFFNSSNLLSSIIDSELFRSITKAGAAKGIFSLFRKNKKRRLSRSQRKKIATRKRRKFVDTVIMRHQEIHQRNRDLAIEEPQEMERKRKLKRKKKKEKGKELEKNKEKEIKSSNSKKWHNTSDIKHKGTIIRGRIDARRLKARSKWLTIA